MMFQMVTGLSPFDQAMETDGLYYLMSKGTQECLDAFWGYLPKEAQLKNLEDGGIYFRDLIQKLLTPEPYERLSVAEIMAHPWFTSYTKSPTAAKERVAKFVH